MKMKPKLFIHEFKKVIIFFKMRDKYKDELKRAIKKYGVVNLPASVQRTIPNDLKVIDERPWWMHPIIWPKIVLIAYKNAQNELVRRLLHA